MAEMKQLTILIDMDDTLENLCEAWVNYLNKRFGTAVKHSEITDWDMTLAFPEVPRSEVYRPLREQALWESVVPLPGAAKYVARLIRDGHKVVIVTASHPDTVKMKLKTVLFRYFPFLTFEDVVVTTQKHLIKGDVLIDDGPHNFRGGTYRGILVNQPHNRSFPAEENGLIRACSWREIYQAVCKIASEE